MLSFGSSVHICSPQRFFNHINLSSEASNLKCYGISGNHKKHILAEFYCIPEHHWIHKNLVSINRTQST